MARKLQIRRGQKANIPTLAEGELGFTLDEKKLYVGHNDGNVSISGVSQEDYDSLIEGLTDRFDTIDSSFNQLDINCKRYEAIFNSLPETYEPIIENKGTAFNKNFGTSAGTVAQGNHTHSFSSLALGETSTTAYRGDRGATAYAHSQSAHAPTNAQKNSEITKAEIEAKLTGVITSHTHNSTYNGSWELLADTKTMTATGNMTSPPIITTLSKEYSQIKLEVTFNNLKFAYRGIFKFRNVDSSTIIVLYDSLSNNITANGKKILVLNRSDHINSNDFSCKSFNSGLYNSTSGVNVVDFKNDTAYLFDVARQDGTTGTLCSSGTVQFRIYGRL